jgi:hypothetical protein
MRVRASATQSESDDGDTLIADVFDGFRSKRIDSSQVKTVTLQSGTYLQVPSRYAMISNIISVHSTMNKSDIPGGAHQGVSPDKRFGLLGYMVPFGSLSQFIKRKSEERNQENKYSENEREQHLERARPTQSPGQMQTGGRHDRQAQVQAVVPHPKSLGEENSQPTRSEKPRNQSGQICDRERRTRHRDNKYAEQSGQSQVYVSRQSKDTQNHHAQVQFVQNAGLRAQYVASNGQNFPAQFYHGQGCTIDPITGLSYPYQILNFDSQQYQLGYDNNNQNYSVQGYSQITSAQNNSVQNTETTSFSYRPRGLSKENIFYFAQQRVNEQVAAEWKAREEEAEYRAREHAEAQYEIRKQAEAEYRAREQEEAEYEAHKQAEAEYRAFEQGKVECKLRQQAGAKDKACTAHDQPLRRVVQQQTNRQYARFLDEMNNESRVVGSTMLMGDAVSGQPAIKIDPASPNELAHPSVLKTMFRRHVRKPTTEVEEDWDNVTTPPRMNLHGLSTVGNVHRVLQGSSMLSPVQFGDTLASQQNRNSSAPLHPCQSMLSPTDSSHSKENMINHRVWSLPMGHSHQPCPKENSDPLSAAGVNGGTRSVVQRSSSSFGNTIFGLAPGTISRNPSPPNGLRQALRGRRLFDRSQMSSPGDATLTSQGDDKRRTSSASCL